MVYYSPDGQRPGRDYEGRRNEAKAIRDRKRDDACDAFSLEIPPTNGDEERFEQVGFPGFATFTKALAHDAKGLVDAASLRSLLDALQAGTQEALEQVQLGGGARRLANPLNAFSYQALGDDSNGARMAAAPAFASRNAAVDMVERYWMALCRDVPFDQYANSGLIQAACDDLNALGFDDQFGFVCTPQTIFRGPYRGCQVGPHVSQFLLQDFNFGNQPISQVQRYPRPGVDYMTDLETWNRVNNGDINPSGTDLLEGSRRITTLRDGGQWVHIDFPHQAGLWATIMLLGLGAETSAAIPYGRDITTAYAFGSLGGPDVSIQSGLAGVYALKHAWFQKWCVHRRLRPEVYAQRLELFRRGQLGSSAANPCHDAKFNDLFGEGAEVWRQTQVLDRIYAHNHQQNIAHNRGNCEGTWLLPMAYPEGSPTHPAYPGGHSAFIAAAATVAKAYFADGPFPCPKVPVEGGTRLADYRGAGLTIHGELNKLIANVTLFRDGAGMHWRTDGTASGPNVGLDRPGTGIETGGNLLGERLAISMLRDTRCTYREQVGTFAFEGIGGNSIEV
ncbi:phosphatidic acid phosphatase [Nodosilinea sp. LEGE 07088]|uniref:phosphatidic acid phosphatase n=1 Tax=Nodosilinea sp. LEGE 07088 TaxID=2777968 RepID=UPI0018810AEA|nr:phosphatidic acid phosphatase [Nodosilinea sp. LEGE 07088]MBE9141438.1 phosphatidic acid phosphatase [Nodosilinea sp. LEGE 07088]